MAPACLGDHPEGQSSFLEGVQSEACDELEGERS